MQFSLGQGIEIRELFGSRIGYFLGSQQGQSIEIRDKALFHCELFICVANFLSGVPFFHHQVNTFFTYQKTGEKAKTSNIKKVLLITARDFMNDTANTQQFTAFRNDICDENKKKDYPMCPRCDKGCPYWPLYDTCIYSKVRLSYAVINLRVVKYK